MAETAWHALVVGPPVLAILALLALVAFGATSVPVPASRPRARRAVAWQWQPDLPVPHYRSILVPLDHSARDRAALAHAVALARSHGATLHLLHVEEGVTSQLFGALSSTEEILSGEQYFGGIVQSLAAAGISAELTIQHGLTPTDAIVQKAREIQARSHRHGSARPPWIEGS